MARRCRLPIGRPIPMPGREGCSNRLPSIALFILCLIMAGCRGEFDGVSEEELHRRARQLPLEERYEFYLRVTSDALPPKVPMLADEVAALGEPAWDYAIARVRDGGPADLRDALPVLDLFDRQCTPSEFAVLMRAAQADYPTLRKTTIEVVEETCHRRQPK